MTANENLLVLNCAMLTLGFGDYIMQHHCVVALVKQNCILRSDFLECWEADINYETKQLTFCIEVKHYTYCFQ